MTNEEILEKQVEALEKLLQLRSAIIEELESKVSSLRIELARQQNAGWSPGTGINTPWIAQQYDPGGSGTTITLSNLCPNGSQHQYPTTWGGTNPPSCSKCGAQMPSWTYGGSITTTATTSGALTSNPTTQGQ